MNGQFPSSPSLSRGAATLGGDEREQPGTARLIAALLLSCLLHSGVVILPYLGNSSKESRSMQEGGRKAQRALSATLTSLKGTPLAVANLSRQGDRSAESSRFSANPDEASRPSRPRREGADWLPLPAPVYYATDQLTKRPQPLAEADLDTPEIRPIIASGKMILKLWINDLGEVIEVEVEKTELPEAFSRAAVAAFKQLRFAAGERHGQAVGSVMRVEVSYVDGRLPPL